MTYGLRFYLGTQLDIIKVRNTGTPYLWIYLKTFLRGKFRYCKLIPLTMTINGTDNIVSKLSNQFVLHFDSGGNKKETVRLNVTIGAEYQDSF